MPAVIGPVSTVSRCVQIRPPALVKVDNTPIVPRLGKPGIGSCGTSRRLDCGQRHLEERIHVAEGEQRHVPGGGRRSSDGEVQRERGACVFRIDDARGRRIRAHSADAREADIVGDRLVVGLFSNDDLMGSGHCQPDREIDVAAGESDNDGIVGSSQFEARHSGAPRNAKYDSHDVAGISVEQKGVDVRNRFDRAFADDLIESERCRTSHWQQTFERQVKGVGLIVRLLRHEELVNARLRQRSDVEELVGAIVGDEDAGVGGAEFDTWESDTHRCGQNDSRVVTGRPRERKDVEIGHQFDRASGDDIAVRDQLPVGIARLRLVVRRRPYGERPRTSTMLAAASM